MAHRKLFIWTLAVLGVIGVSAILVVGALHFAARSLKEDILQALGPESEVADVRVGFTSIIVTDVKLPGGKGWPAKAALTAERVVIVPDLRQLVQRRVHINRMTFENAYISAVRPKSGGGLKILPTMLGEHKKKKAGQQGRDGTIDVVELANCIVEVFDNTVVGHQKMRVDAVHGTIRDIQVPGLDGRSKIDLQGAIRGPQHQGSIAVRGWVDAGKKASELATTVRNVDLGLFEPYVIQKTEAGIDKGTFNLDLKSSVHDNQVRATGTLTLAGLKLKSEGLSGVSQRALIGALADESDVITAPFEIAGSLDDPTFSLSEGLAFKTAAGLLKGLGIGFEALIRAFFIIVNGFGSVMFGAAS